MFILYYTLPLVTQCNLILILCACMLFLHHIGNTNSLDHCLHFRSLQTQCPWLGLVRLDLPTCIHPQSHKLWSRFLAMHNRCILLSYYLTSLIKCQKLLSTSFAHLASASSLLRALIVRFPSLPLCLLKPTKYVFILFFHGWLVTLLLYHILCSVTLACIALCTNVVSIAQLF